MTLLEENNELDGLSVWDRAPLSLQADTDDANVSVSLPSITANTEDGDSNLYRSSVGVYNVNDGVTLDFGENVDAKEHDGDAQILTAYLNESVEDDDVDFSDLPTSMDELESELTQENLDNLNENITFSDSNEDINDGTFSHDADFDEGAGAYTYIVATEDTFTVDEGDLEDVHEGTVLGAEQVVAHEEPSEVDVDSSAEPGDDITFDVTATEFDDDLNGSVNHGVVLYNESGFDASSATLYVDGELNTDLSAEDVTLETEIESLNGVQNLSDDVSAWGEEIESQNKSGELTLETVFNFFMDEADIDERPSMNTTDDTIQLDASSTAVVGDTSEEITVETYDNWSETDYQWIHVATGTSSDEIQVNADTIEIEEDDDESTGGGGISPSPSPDPSGPEFDVEAGLSDSKIMPGESVDVTATISEVSGDRGGIYTAELMIDGEVVDEEEVHISRDSSESVTFTHTFDESGEYDVAVSDVTAGTVSVSADHEEDPDEEEDDEAEFELYDASLSDTEVEVGDSVTAGATVENVGGDSGTYTAELIVDGSAVDEETVTLGPGAVDDVSFTHSFDETGEYDIAINDENIGTVTVDEDSGLLPVPGFGAPAALFALLASALIAIRLND
ncbi:APHP domain-containing protein [Natronolimnobius sp. AArcel1]|uniref:CARDB domain-containing protein n=1 Tax=Natronolimnobius sp. AArcel1 TaxID=1679093 RepID=UPI0013EAB6D6|nr:CARDB domain-containing protein [Natronolimnobius sp. AArcel1]NGM70762.1 APHP domain-containing protein [Natronolimnobius sp. AArcel1]